MSKNEKEVDLQKCEKESMLVIRRVCHLRGDTDILIDFVCVYILNYTFGGNVMDSETSVEELKV